MSGNILYDFYIYQIRKDLIDKLNICNVAESNLSLGLKIEQKVSIPKGDRSRPFKILYKRSLFESCCGYSAGIRKVRQYDKVKRHTKLSSSFFYYEFYCHLFSNKKVFHFINCLYCIFKLFNRTKFKLTLNEISWNKNKTLFMRLKRIYMKHFFWIPRARKVRKPLHLSFYIMNNQNIVLQRIICFVLFRRLGLLRKHVPMIDKKSQSI